jgi:hypothetical protein
LLFGQTVVDPLTAEFSARVADGLASVSQKCFAAAVSEHHADASE